MNRLSKIVFEMKHEDLVLLRKDLEEGNLKKLIDEKIAETEPKRKKLCPVCHSDANEDENGTMTLTFGPKGFKKKATFCATDCLEYFILHLKKINQYQLHKGDSDGYIRNNEDI